MSKKMDAQTQLLLRLCHAVEDMKPKEAVLSVIDEVKETVKPLVKKPAPKRKKKASKKK